MPAAAASRSALTRHDRRVLAAHLGDRRPRVRALLEARGRAPGPTSAEPVKTTPSIAPSASARPVAGAAVHEADDAVGQPRGGERLADERARQRRLLGRLDHDACCRRRARRRPCR